MDTRNQYLIWSDAAIRYLMASALSKYLPLYIVTEYPKSGGTWVAQMVADYLGVNFPRNSAVRFEKAVHHAHYLYSPLLKNVVVVMRDGRDIVVSYYYYMLFENDRASPVVVRNARKALNFKDYDDIKENLPRFLEYLFDKQARSISPFQFTWPKFVRSWIDRDVVTVKYEDLINDGIGEFSNVILQLTRNCPDRRRIESVIDKFSFRAQTSRSPGEEIKNQFLRKGVPGDWKEKFTRSAAKLFDQIAGQELQVLGYEKDSSWIDSVR